MLVGQSGPACRWLWDDRTRAEQSRGARELLQFQCHCRRSRHATSLTGDRSSHGPRAKGVHAPPGLNKPAFLQPYKDLPDAPPPKEDEAADQPKGACLMRLHGNRDKDDGVSPLEPDEVDACHQHDRSAASSAPLV